MDSGAPLPCRAAWAGAARRDTRDRRAPRPVSSAARRLRGAAARCVKRRDDALFRYSARFSLPWPRGPCGRGGLFPAAAARRRGDPGPPSSQEAAGPVGSVAATGLVALAARAVAAFFRDGRPTAWPRNPPGTLSATPPPREDIAPTPKPTTPGSCVTRRCAPCDPRREGGSHGRADVRPPPNGCFKATSTIGRARRSFRHLTLQLGNSDEQAVVHTRRDKQLSGSQGRSPEPCPRHGRERVDRRGYGRRDPI